MAEDTEKLKELLAGKYQIVGEDEHGKKCAMQHPFPTVQDAENEIGPIHQRHENQTITHDDKVYMKWVKLNIYKRTDTYPYACDYSTSFYEEFKP